ncbi:hypothetical protein COEREDRAFT_47548, partial [Coemansia reversa NRRL 1564]
MAQGFLEAFPTFVPGLYPSPTDWPFWEENERIHARIRPHLANILWRERRQNQSHARRLQEEYSTLYAKWRKRVDKLDRQREAKQRNMASGQTGGGSESGAELFTSDAVHSEAELQAIIERLQHDDARNPDLRSQRTAATIPDMVV